MAGRSYDLPDSVSIQSHADSEMAINDILAYLAATVSGLQSDGTYKMYLNGLDGDTYIKYDPDTKILSFYIDGEEHGRMNVT